MAIMSAIAGILIYMIPIWFPDSQDSVLYYTGCSGRGCLEYIVMVSGLSIWVIFHIVYIRKAWRYLHNIRVLRKIAEEELRRCASDSENSSNDVEVTCKVYTIKDARLNVGRQALR